MEHLKIWMKAATRAIRPLQYDGARRFDDSLVTGGLSDGSLSTNELFVLSLEPGNERNWLSIWESTNSEAFILLRRLYTYSYS